MNTQRAITAERRILAKSCSIACLGYAVVFLAFYFCSVWTGGRLIFSVAAGYMYLVGFPIALIYMIIAIQSVGFSRCKMAWISFSIFLVPLLWFILRVVAVLTGRCD